MDESGYDPEEEPAWKGHGRSEAAEPESFVPLLESIRGILLRHDYFVQGTWVAELIDLAHLQSSNFAGELGGGQMWGSMGSVADVVDLRHSLDPVDAETERDSLELTLLLIRLGEQMKTKGISSEGSEFVASGFRRHSTEAPSPRTRARGTGPPGEGAQLR